MRGVCGLRPGLPNISENIRVTSVVDRFLEHSRMYVFSPDEEAKVFLSSADWMPRNFHRRVEVMFPIEAREPKERILHEIIPSYLRDNCVRPHPASRWQLRAIETGAGESPWRCQFELLRLRPTLVPVERMTAAERIAAETNGTDSHPETEPAVPRAT